MSKTPNKPAVGMSTERMDDGRLDCAPSRRNQEPILRVLEGIRLPPASPRRVLEIASGSGVHGCYLASNLDDVRWQPTDCEPDSLRSIEAWRAHHGLTNLMPPHHLDVLEDPWPLEECSFEALVCINMIHIAPWEATEALMAGAARVLVPEGVLYTYGAYLENGALKGPGDKAFHEELRRRNPAWGLRDTDDVERAAARHGLTLEAKIPMPKGNLSLVFRRCQAEG